MPLKFELLQADAHSSYLLHGKTDILYNLRSLMQKRGMLSAFIDASADSFLTAILAISPDERYLILDAASDEAINRRVEVAEQLICITQLDKIKIQFATRQLQRITHEGHAAFRTPLPEVLLRLAQHLEFELDTRARIKQALRYPVMVLAAIGITGLIPKALISTYLSFFPVAVGMVKGLRSPEIMHLDLMHTYNASPSQTFWKLRVPASVPFLFASMKVAIAASLVGAIVGELPTGAVAGIGAKLLNASYFSNTIDMWAALVAGSVVALLLVGLVGVVARLVQRGMGARPA